MTPRAGWRQGETLERLECLDEKILLDPSTEKVDKT